MLPMNLRAYKTLNSTNAREKKIVAIEVWHLQNPKLHKGERQEGILTVEPFHLPNVETSH